MNILRLLPLFIWFVFLNHSGSNAQTLTSGKSDQMKTDSTNTSVFYQKSSLELIVKNEVQGKYLVQVFNLTGTEVLRHETINTTTVKIPATKLKNGVYLVRVAPVPNQPSATFKIMVK